MADARSTVVADILLPAQEIVDRIEVVRIQGADTSRVTPFATDFDG